MNWYVYRASLAPALFKKGTAEEARMYLRALNAERVFNFYTLEQVAGTPALERELSGDPMMSLAHAIERADEGDDA